MLPPLTPFSKGEKHFNPLQKQIKNIIIGSMEV